MLVKVISKHTQHFVKDKAKHAGLALKFSPLYFDVKQKPVLCGESKDYKTCEKDSYEAIKQSSRKKRQKKSSKKDDDVS
eukprot:10722457-Ditylum_brightwellii.AAC.1